jgi:hypothetical protein
LRFDAGGLFGAGQDALGDVKTGLAGAGGALLFASSPGAAIVMAVGPRAEVSLAWASGSPAGPTTSSGGGSGLAVSASILAAFGVRISSGWRLTLDLEGGGVIAPFDARADGRRVTGMDGAMMGLSVGLTQWR